MDNIQLMTFEENRTKAHKDRKIGKLITSQNIEVIQMTKEGLTMNRFYSIAEASKVTGIVKSNIARASKGEKNSWWFCMEN